ncbi:MAG: PHP domain-containing protein [Phycisphaerales bacterium]|nr:PHP domain-containing protein [Phycisphaerales bacterium]
MTQFVDLHTHSTASDGTYSPTELIRAAKACGLAGIALTDHDTGNGLKEAVAEAEKVGMRFVPGIEISAEFPLPGTLHILGHFVDPDAPGLHRMSKILLESRNARNPLIVRRLNELGCKITMEQVRGVATEKVPVGAAVVVGRPHIAEALVRAGCVASIRQAFDVYLGTTGSAYFPKERLTPRQAIECIHEAGGLATVAHPVQLRCENAAHLATIVNHLAEAGLDGIEVWHSDHNNRAVTLMLELAEKYHLVPTGGSDFHGRHKADVVLGHGRRNVKVAVEALDRLEERWRQRGKYVAKSSNR